MPEPDPRSASAPVTHERRSRLAWLLAVPVLLVLYPPLYNREDPALFGIPFFYAWQLLVIPVSVACTVVVYRATTSRTTSRTDRAGGDR